MLAICALSPDKDKSILAYPCPLQQTTLPASISSPSHVPPGSQEWHHAASQNVGDVRIYDAQTGQALNTIQAHKSAIGYLALNASGTLLATASEKGTIIRIFEVPGGSGNQPLFEFRRGTIPVRIYHMSFNATSTLLCVSSASETVHIFKLVKPVKNNETSPPVSPISASHRRTLSSSSRERSESVSSEDLADPSLAGDDAPPTLERKPSGWSGQIASRLRQASQSVGAGMAARVGGYLPQSVTQGLEAQRDFAHVKIPRAHNSSGILRSVVAMSPNHPQLFVVTSEGQFGVYNIDLENGGDGILERQHSILDSRSAMMYNPDD
jgi:autophagy-related protein 18